MRYRTRTGFVEKCMQKGSTRVSGTVIAGEGAVAEHIYLAELNSDTWPVCRRRPRGTAYSPARCTRYVYKPFLADLSAPLSFYINTTTTSFPPTIEDKDVIDTVRVAIEQYFDALAGSPTSSTAGSTSDSLAASTTPRTMGVKPTMKALQLERPAGEPKKGQRNIAAVREVPTPQPSSGQVLVKILAAGFNRRDEWSMVGAYPGLVFKNATMGCDGAGVVVAPAGFDMPNEHPDKLVLLTPTRGWVKDKDGPEAELPGLSDEQRRNGLGGKGFGILGATAPTNGVGTFAEYVAVEKDQLVPAPKHLTPEQAATLPCAAVTAYRYVSSTFSPPDIAISRALSVCKADLLTRTNVLLRTLRFTVRCSPKPKSRAARTCCLPASVAELHCSHSKWPLQPEQTSTLLVALNPK